MKLKWLFAVALTSVMPWSAAFAQQESLGEYSQVLSCFYECEPGTTSDTWGEVTGLVLVNPTFDTYFWAETIFLDGHDQMIGRAYIALSPDDIDSVNVCRTLYKAGIDVPRTGLIEIALWNVSEFPLVAGEGVYGWGKGYVGRFFKTQDDPFAGRIEGASKTECRILPPSILTFSELGEKMVAQNPPIVSYYLSWMGGTSDGDQNPENQDLENGDRK